MAETKIISGKGFLQEKERERREKRHERPEPFWPRFSTKTTTIYARPFGSDERGDGSLKKPFRTFQHAIRFVPALIPPSQRYVVDITGIGTETLPADYAIPEIVNSRTFFIDLTDPDFVTRAEGLAEDDVQDLATERLEEAVVRSREHVADYRDLAAWARAYADLRAWLRAVPAPAASP